MRHIPSAAPTRRALLAAPFAFLTLAGGAAAQGAGVVSITVDESMSAIFGTAEIIIDGKTQGYLAAGCCMFSRVGPGPHQLTLRWADREVTATFDGGEAAAFHLTAERVLTRLDE